MTDSTNASRWKRPSRWVPLVLLAILILGFTAYRIASGSGMKRELAAIRSRGLPTNGEELDKWYASVPARENAALAFLDAASLYVEPGSDDPSEMNKFEMQLGKPLPPELASAVEQLLDENRETIEAAHKATELNKSRYPIDLTKGAFTLLPHLAKVKRLAQLFKWEAVQQSQRGNRAEALKAIKSGFTLAGTLENEPLLISELVRIASISIMLPALERVVTEQTLTDAELADLIQVLARTEEQGKTSFQRALVGERALGIPGFQMDYRTFEMLVSGGVSAGNASDLPGLLQMTLFEVRRALGISNQDFAFFLTRMNEFERATHKPWTDMLREMQGVSARIDQELPKHRIRYLISGMTLPSLSKAVNREVILTGNLRCAIMALTIERYRLKHGKLPTLDELVPAYLPQALTDPANGEALQYEKLPNGYRVISAGATELKNEGVKEAKRTDVAFEVMR